MKLAPWVLCAALGLWLSFALRGEGYATDEARRLAAVNDSLRRVSAKVDTVYRVQRDTLFRRIARVDTLTQTVEAWKHDTLRVVEYVTRADSALQACSVVVRTCEERVSLRDQRITALEARGRALEARVPSKWAKLRDGLAWAGAGYLTASLMRR